MIGNFEIRAKNMYPTLNNLTYSAG